MKARESTKAGREHLQNAKRIDGGLINSSDIEKVIAAPPLTIYPKQGV